MFGRLIKYLEKASQLQSGHTSSVCHLTSRDPLPMCHSVPAPGGAASSKHHHVQLHAWSFHLPGVMEGAPRNPALILCWEAVKQQLLFIVGIFKTS